MLDCVNSVSIFGTSIHNDDNNGKGYEELNYGLSLHFGSKALTDPISLDYQLGAFRNIYNGLAYWLGAEFSYYFTKEIIAAVDIRKSGHVFSYRIDLE